jgi:hypothetical protein
MYILGGVIVPCLFVGPAVFLDIYGDAYLASGYGKKPCFPHIFPANLVDLCLVRFITIVSVAIDMK